MLSRRREVAEVDDRGGVGDARGGAQEHRSVELLGEVEGGLDHLVGFLAVGGLEQRNLGELGVEAVVLLVLRAVHAGVVGARRSPARRSTPR